MLYALFLCFTSFSEGGEGAELRGGGVQLLLEYQSSAITSEASSVYSRVHSTRDWHVPFLWERASVSEPPLIQYAFLASSLLPKRVCLFFTSHFPFFSQQPFSRGKRQKLKEPLNFLFSLNICAYLHVSPQDSGHLLACILMQWRQDWKP